MFLTRLALRTGNVCMSSRRYVALVDSYHGPTLLVFAWTALPVITVDLVKSSNGHSVSVLTLGECFLFTKFSLPKGRR